MEKEGAVAAGIEHVFAGIIFIVGVDRCPVGCPYLWVLFDPEHRRHRVKTNLFDWVGVHGHCHWRLRLQDSSGEESVESTYIFGPNGSSRKTEWGRTQLIVALGLGCEIMDQTLLLMFSCLSTDSFLSLPGTLIFQVLITLKPEPGRPTQSCLIAEDPSSVCSKIRGRTLDSGRSELSCCLLDINDQWFNTILLHKLKYPITEQLGWVMREWKNNSGPLIRQHAKPQPWLETNLWFAGPAMWCFLCCQTKSL